MKLAFKDRQASFAETETAFRDQHSTERSRLAALQRDNDDRLEVALREHRAEHDAFVDSLEVALAKEVQGKLCPIIPLLATEPRRAAETFASTVCTLHERAVFQLGVELDVRHIGIAIATAHGVEDRLSTAEFWNRGSKNEAAACVERLRRAILTNAPLVIVETAIRECELALAERAMRFPSDPERLAALVSRATTSAISAALLAFDQAREAAEREARRPADEAHRSAWYAEQQRLKGGGPPTQPMIESPLGLLDRLAQAVHAR